MGLCATLQPRASKACPIGLTYTRQKDKSKYRAQVRFEKASQNHSSGTNKTPYDRVKHCREHKRMNAAELIKDSASTSLARVVEIIQEDDEIASTLTSDCVGIDCVRSLFMKTH
ncbi:uncharacterized protein TNCT_646261 [Trichonephila clavata]|uniref:Uncharacterized protein n=1 Tax=Trichonephila clavata TaxID=2740835 RepID=A0A8X6LL90_TRICU|nr:uncharacterized protein TNCT_646261 [Trichonephila clavata]